MIEPPMGVPPNIAEITRLASNFKWLQGGPGLENRWSGVAKLRRSLKLGV
jgi:hypothetical protein